MSDMEKQSESLSYQADSISSSQEEGFSSDINEKRHRGSRNFWGSLEMWGGVWFLLEVLIHIFSSSLIGVFHIDDERVSLLIVQLFVLLPAFIYMIIIAKDHNPFHFMRFRKFHLGSAFLIPLYMLALLPVNGVLNAVSMLFFRNEIGDTATDVIGGNLVIGLLMMAVLPAFVEESTFRGAVYRSFRGAHPVRAIIFTGFAFGAMHMNFNQFFYATFLGIAMGFLLEATGSIVSTMILHFCFNANSVILMWALPKIEEIASGIDPNVARQFSSGAAATDITPAELMPVIGAMLPVAIAGLALAYLWLYLIARLNRRWNYFRYLFSPATRTQRDAFEKPWLLNPFVIVSFALCLFVCIYVQYLE